MVLDQIIRQADDDPDQKRFRNLLLRLRDSETTVDDWKILLRRTPTKAQNLTSYENALHLYPTVEAAVDHNVSKLNDSRKPIAIIHPFTSTGRIRRQIDHAGGQGRIFTSHLSRCPTKRQRPTWSTRHITKVSSLSVPRSLLVLNSLFSLLRGFYANGGKL